MTYPSRREALPSSPPSKRGKQKQVKRWKLDLYYKTNKTYISLKSSLPIKSADADDL